MQAALHGKVLGADVFGGYYKGTKPLGQIEFGYKGGGYANSYDILLDRYYNGITDAVRDYWQVGLGLGGGASYYPSKSAFGFDKMKSESIGYLLFNITKQHGYWRDNTEIQYTGDIAFDLAFILGIHFRLRTGYYK